MIIFDELKFIDLTHTLHSEMPHWREDCGFQHQMILDYQDCTSNTKFRVQSLSLYAGVGTHMDAPSHCIPGAKNIDEISLDELIVPCVVIDLSQHLSESYCVSLADIQAFEENNGQIPKASFVLIRTGWDQFWNQPEKYRNNLKFPTISIEASEALLRRDIVGLGIDSLSPDNPENDFPVHQLVLGAGKYIIENVANAGLMPATGAYIMALPLKIQGGTESPIRLIGVVRKC